jgi:hypothetical protein
MTGDTFEKVKKGVKDTAEEVKETAEKITDPDTYTGSAQEKEIKENREYNEAGEYVSISKGNNMTFDQGHGVLTTKDGSETANYTFIEVSNGTAYQGASAYSTNSTGKLSSLNNILVIFKGPTNESGNYALEQWHWK